MENNYSLVNLEQPSSRTHVLLKKSEDNFYKGQKRRILNHMQLA